MTRDQWLEAFAAAAETTAPSDADIEALLELAGIAAHASERTAAPITCWIAAVAGLSPADAIHIARRVRGDTD
jgi:C4-dicarboxylate transporter